jgi:hypothetical protein
LYDDARTCQRQKLNSITRHVTLKRTWHNFIYISVTPFSNDSHIRHYDDWQIMEAVLGSDGNGEKYMQEETSWKN